MEIDYGLLNLTSDEVTYIYKGVTYRMTSVIYEPSLLLWRDDELVCVLHNSYTTEELVKAFTTGKTIKTGLGKDYDKEYDEVGFCKVLAAVIDSGRNEIDLFYAAKLAKKESL